jgi:hypothetical protein
LVASRANQALITDNYYYAPSNQITANDASIEVVPNTDALERKPLLDITAGALARAGSQAAIHPIDTMKVRMQAGDLSSAGASLRKVPHFST